MCKVLVFAGTTEGYGLCRFLSGNQVSVCACVATGYGSKSLEEGPYLHVRAERLDENGMEALLKEIQPELVLDATHPYAAQVTENIQKACQAFALPYERVLREEGKHQGDAVYVGNTEEAVEYLKGTKGNILLTTGSKELGKFARLPDYQNRLYARVLSLPSVLEACRSLGIEGRHLLGLQGPFSREMNVAMLRQYGCRYLVTKDSGKAGGFQEKMEAAAVCGAIPVIIGRPLREEGMSLAECKAWLAQHFSISLRPSVTLLGIGMGSMDTLTIEGKRALDHADLLIGARRIVDSVRQPHQQAVYEYNSEKILEYIEKHPEYENIVITLSGDVGFYSGAKKLAQSLEGNNHIRDINVICGISSVVYFMAKAGLSWDDARIVSAHGRSCNLISLIQHNRKVFAILGTADGVAKLAQKLVYYGLGEVLLYVGENLSYDNEKVFVKPARELDEYEGDALSVVCAVNENPEPLFATHGIPDEAFHRGKAPMTKEEVRTVSLSKLRLTEDSICYDVGAGTGSVSIEMALRAYEGKVYAIEKKEEAARLLEINRHRFAADNLEIIRGEAPQALEGLPVPTHAFIGGSSGNLKEIIKLLLKKNPKVRIVINCITLETVTEALQVIKQYGFEENEIVQLNAARSKTLGQYHMMMGENPIYIITCQKEGGSI